MSKQNDKAVPKRFWAQHKIEAVLQLLRDEDIETLSRELGVTAAKLSEWRDAFLTGGADSLKKCSPAFDSWRQRTLWGDGGRGDESVHLALHRSDVWTGAGVACLGHPQVFELCPQGCD